MVKLILLIVTQATDLGNGVPTGVWLEELTTPYYEFVDAGYEVHVATLNGGVIPIDPKSYNPEGDESPVSVVKFMADVEAADTLKNSKKLSDLNFADYEAIFFPGGHGAVVDLPKSELLAEQLGKAYDAGKVIGAVCHGPAALVSAKRADGQSILAGKKVNGFTNTEEAIAESTEAVPFLLEDKMKELGGKFESGPDFEAYAVRDGNIITGQNPASSEKTAQLIIEALKEKE